MKPRSSSPSPWFRRTDLFLITLALLGLGLNTLNQKMMYYRVADDYQLKIAAAERANRCIEAIRVRHKGFHPETLDENRVDESGLIGESQTRITTYDGRQEAKQISVNPNWAAVVVEWFREIDLKEGDPIGVGVTGSFPALNIAVLAAAEEMGLRPILITSVGASSWGANDPNFTWLDMERFLSEQGILTTRSVAASLGGRSDQGRGLVKEVVQLLQEAIDRNGIPHLESKKLSEAVESRIAIYDSLSGPDGIRAYVNVGGGVASVGLSKDRPIIKPGLEKVLPAHDWGFRGVLQRFGARGLPVINLAEMVQLSERYDLKPYLSEEDPTDESPIVQPVGWGRVYGETVYRLLVLIPALIAYLALCVVVLWTRHRAARQLTQAAAAPPTPGEIADELLRGQEGGNR